MAPRADTIARLVAQSRSEVPGSREASQALGAQLGETDAFESERTSGITAVDPFEQQDAFDRIRALGEKVKSVKLPEPSFSRVEQAMFGQSSFFTPAPGEAGSGKAPVLGQFRISQGPGPNHSTGHGGRAWDYAVPVGTKLQSTVKGTVVAVRDLGNSSYGKYVMIKGNDGKTYIYAHLSAFGVSVGQQVAPGQIIAKSGNSGKSTGPHLHYEIRG